MTTIDLPQGTISYRAAGPAESSTPPVVLVHGLLVSSTLWTGVQDALAGEGVRSFAPDLPLGAHRIPLRPDADISPRGVARMLLDLLAALDLTDVTLVGNDTGGALCQFLIDTDPSRIGRLVLTNCDAFDQFPPAPFGMLVRACRHPALIRAMMPTMRPTAMRHSAFGFGPLARRLDADVTRGWVEPLSTSREIRDDTARFTRGMHKSELLDVSTRLDRFGKPVRVVWGTADRFFKVSLARRLCAAFPNATLVEVDGGRTFLSVDQPQRVADEIRAAQAA